MNVPKAPSQESGQPHAVSLLELRAEAWWASLSPSRVFITLVMAGALLFGTACGTDDYSSQSCVTDEDCNGGLCENGTCADSQGVYPAEFESTSPSSNGNSNNGANDAGSSGSDASNNGGDNGQGDGGEGSDSGNGDDTGGVADGDNSDAAQGDAGDDSGSDADSSNDIGEGDQGDDTGDPNDTGMADMAGENGCGGEVQLPGVPGNVCGVCADGEWACRGSNDLVCVEASPSNLCGGCEELEETPGTDCECEDEPGLWFCENTDAVACDCSGQVQAGSCAAPLPVEFGESVSFSNCEEGNSTSPTEGQVDCVDTDLGGPDVVFAFTLDHPERVNINLRDNDEERAIDTVVYLRSICDDPESQLVCGDDVPCESSEVPGACIGNEQVRESNLELQLASGTYYLYADSYNYSLDGGLQFGCGVVQLTVDLQNNDQP